MHIIDGVLKEYAWGRPDGLVPWCAPTGGPQAELWFGAHPAGPSPLVAQPGETLADVVGAGDVPLVKLLAAAQPLSIQVHPDAERAERGFAAQSQPGSPEQLAALFADAAEKSEILIPLTSFSTHAGWRDPAMAADALARAGAPAQIVDVVRTGSRPDAVRAVLTIDQAQRHAIESRLVAAVADWPEEARAALAAVLVDFAGDPGTLVTLLLAHQALEPGMALAVPAGVVHSYVHGLAVEVMTSSDNVLRLGLTAKPIAIDEALAAIRQDRTPEVLGAPENLSTATGSTVAHVAASTVPFDVDIIDTRGGAPANVDVESEATCTVLCLEGQVRTGDEVFDPGQAGVHIAGNPAEQISIAGRAVIVTPR